MLSIGKMVARSGEYYIATVANGREEYYTGSGESPGFWLGEGPGGSGSKVPSTRTTSARCSRSGLALLVPCPDNTT